MLFKKKSPAERLYCADQAVKKYCANRTGKLNARQHRKLGKLLDARADALSDVLGVKVYSVTGRK